MYAFIFQAKSSTTTPIPSPQSETMSSEYRSQFLKFSFFVPSGFKVRENGNIIVLSKEENTISINRAIGYSSSVEEYLTDLSDKNHTTIKYLEDTYGFNKIQISYGDNIPNTISYIKNIDTDTFISISTSSPELYDELDQIAASFQYLGNSQD